jgi:solute carrier family 25 (mitochondrial carnitine/acylcarnitine transporter), member 20/29
MASENETRQTVASSLAGMMASSVGKTLLHPIDTVKAKLQVRDTRLSIAQTARQTLKVEGISGLYRGLPISLIGSLPATALYFGSYEFFKSQTLQNKWLQ